MNQPLDLISTEIVFRSLYHFSQAVLRGDATDAVSYLVKRQKLLDCLKLGVSAIERLTLTLNKFGLYLLKLTLMKPLRKMCF
jgi:hypothetical protein